MKGDEGEKVDFKALEQLVEFQVVSGVSGIVAVGTTGESPTLSWEEHHEVIIKVHEFARGRCDVIAGAGSNCTDETMRSMRHIVKHGIRAALLVEPYYNGPSSIEIRREYMAPVAQAFPDVEIIPYVIPGRTGCQLLPEDLAILHNQYDNVSAVKEASGSLENMRRTRECCGLTFQILSGDDDRTLEMMTDPKIAACGVVSVISNVAPAAVQRMTEAILTGNMEEGRALHEALKPLFEIVTVKTQEPSPYGERLCKARNPLPIKTLMRLLGMPVGVCRRPLGRMTRRGLDVVLQAARRVWQNNPEILEPIGRAFDVDVAERLQDPRFLDGLYYED
jgi:4-hydroxy-tetrahydrodipicolinate synthase